MKIISPTAQQIELITKNFKNNLKSQKSLSGRIDFSEDLNKLLDLKAERRTVAFTLEALTKIRKYVDGTSKEIGWHGVVEHNRDTGTYLIKDVMLYPQIVTGATVQTDDGLYTKWLMEQTDEVFEKLRFQGHSHVRMGTSPSGVDLNYYQSILETLEDDEFYIFMITNKQGTITIWIHELFNNTIFETSDIDVKIIDSKGQDLDAKLKEETKKYVTEITTTVVDKGFRTGFQYNSYEDYMTQPKNKNKNKNKSGITIKDFYNKGVSKK